METRSQRRVVAPAAGCRALSTRQRRASKRQGAAGGISDPLPRRLEGGRAASERHDARLRVCRPDRGAARARLDLLLHPALSAQSLELYGPQFRGSRADESRTESDRTDAGRQRNLAGRTRVSPARRKMDRYTRAFFVLLLSGAAGAADYTVLDVQNVPLWGDPSSAVVHFTTPE